MPSPIDSTVRRALWIVETRPGVPPIECRPAARCEAAAGLLARLASWFGRRQPQGQKIYGKGYQGKDPALLPPSSSLHPWRKPSSIEPVLTLSSSRTAPTKQHRRPHPTALRPAVSSLPRLLLSPISSRNQHWLRAVATCTFSVAPCFASFFLALLGPF